MRKKLTIHGELADGGVKYVAQRYAMQMHLTGVSSRGADGTVVIEIEGPEDILQQFKDEIAKGSQFFTVTSIDEVEIPEVSEKMFRVG